MKLIKRIGETLLITEGMNHKEKEKKVKIIDERKVDSKSHFQLAWLKIMLHTFTFTEIFFELSTFSVRKEKLFAEACRDTCHIVLADEFIIFVTRFKVCFHGCTYNSVSIVKVVQTRWNKWEQWERW